MIIVRITEGPDSGKTIVDPSEEPEELFASFLSTDSEWEIDYDDATLQEKNDWLSKDLFNRCLRALCVRKLPVMLNGESFDDFEEFKDKKGYWFTNMVKFTTTNLVRGTTHTYHGSYASTLSIVRDDETGVQIERKGYKEQYSIYKESTGARIEFRKKGLNEEHFLEFFQEDLLEKMSQSLNEEVDELLNYAEQFKCKMSRSFLAELLSLVIRQGTDRKLVTRLREQIQKTRM